jgi:hypothetical protein
MATVVSLAAVLPTWSWPLLAALAGLLAAGAAHAAGEPAWCHPVRPGDTLARIARRHRVPLQALRDVNRGLGTKPPRAGLRLALPSLRALRDAALPLAPRSLRAVDGSLRRENAAARRDHLSFMRDTGMVGRFVAAGRLVRLPAETATYEVAGVDPRLRLARPWTKRFVEQLAGALHGLFGERLRVTSLTRTPERQAALRRSNANAAPARGDLRSTHLTGAAVDLSRRSLSPEATVWLRAVLRRLTTQGVVHAIEEFREPHFHVLVRARYAAYARTLADSRLIGGC